MSQNVSQPVPDSEGRRRAGRRQTVRFNSWARGRCCGEAGANLYGVARRSGPKAMTHSSQDRSPNARLCRSRAWWRTTGDRPRARCPCSCGTTGRRTGRADSRGGRESSPGLCRSLGRKKKGENLWIPARRRRVPPCSCCLKLRLWTALNWNAASVFPVDLCNQTHGEQQRMMLQSKQRCQIVVSPRKKKENKNKAAYQKNAVMDLL